MLTKFLKDLRFDESSNLLKVEKFFQQVPNEVQQISATVVNMNVIFDPMKLYKFAVIL